MQSKRYQVFVSSTYVDLKAERRSVIETLLDQDCIPAGMEWFGAVDEEQFEYIKRVVDDCDYYVVIIGNRYGTPTADGISYTEKEYEYAVSKGLKVVAFLHKNPGDLPAKHVDDDPEAKKKLEAFRKKLETNRLVHYWESSGDLAGKVATSMSKMIRMHPAVGWIRANQGGSLVELNDLRKENEQLKLALSKVTPEIKGLAGLDELVTVRGTYNFNKEWSLEVRWGKVVEVVGPSLIGGSNEDRVQSRLNAGLFALSGLKHDDEMLALLPHINEGDFITIRLQLVALRLVTVSAEAEHNVWSLTAAGEQLVAEALAIRAKV